MDSVALVTMRARKASIRRSSVSSVDAYTTTQRELFRLREAHLPSSLGNASEICKKQGAKMR
jgi:hypothetical protein